MMNGIEVARQLIGQATVPTVLARTPAGSMGEMGSAVTEQLGQALDKWPVEFLGISAAALFAGLVLWIAGAKLVRPIFITLGLLGGGFLGALIVPGFGAGPDAGETLLGLPPATAGLIIGGVLGLIVASLLFRLAVAGSAGIALGAAGLLAATVYISTNPDPNRTEPPPRDALSLLLPGVTVEGEKPSNSTRARQVSSIFRAEAGDQWQRWTMRERALLMAGLVVPAALGFGIGSFAPKRTAAVISAPLGAAVWLAGGVGLLFAAGQVPERVSNSTPMMWAIVWGLVAIAGVGIQVLLLGRTKKKRASKDDDESDDE